MVGPGRLELPTSRLSGVRSNHLSYGPILGKARTPNALQKRQAGVVRILVRKRNVDGGSRHTVMMLSIYAAYVFRWSPDWCHLCSKKHGKGHIGEPIVFQFHSFLRKEVIQPQVPLRLPCYDFTPVADPTVAGCVPCGFAHRLRVKPTPMV